MKLEARETIGVVGIGVFGSQLVAGLGKDGYRLLANNRAIGETYRRLVDKGLVNYAEAVDLSNLCRSRYIFVATRQKDMEGKAGILAELKRFGLTADQIIISAAAGVSIDSIRSYTSEQQKVVRLMTGLGARIGKGVVAVATSDVVTDREREDIVTMLSCLGRVVVCQSEEQVDRLTGFLGSHGGLDLYLTGLKEILASWGHTEEEAGEMVSQLYCGLADHERATNLRFDQRYELVGKGLVTSHLNQILLQGGLVEVVGLALEAAGEKTRSLDIKKGLAAKDT